jgi:site-specific DNA-cytosine methylase
MNGIRYFSMFTGVGGFEIGLQNAGLIQQESSGGMSNFKRATPQFYSCVGFSEIDKYANQLLANKFPDIKNYGKHL